MTIQEAARDRINLGRLVKRLEKEVAEQNWSQHEQPRQTWIQATMILQNYKYARKLLYDVEQENEIDPSSSLSHQKYAATVKESLDKLEGPMQDVERRAQLHNHRPKSLLATLPLPTQSISTPTRQATSPVETLIPGPDDATELRSHATSGPLLSIPADKAAISRPLLPNAPAFLSTSLQTQEELSRQLSQMATQLKRNAIHFGESLARDKTLIEGAQEKLDDNYDTMKKERVRLRDHHGKSWGTTWITLLSVIVVCVAFILTFFIIRLT